MEPKIAAIPGIGRKIERIRMLKGIKQETLATKIGVSQSALSKIEQSEEVDEDKLKIIADAMDLTMEAIKNFNEESAINTINTFHDSSSFNFQCQFNPIDCKELKKNILFSQHNLVVDQVFNEFQLICCRNVMIYFNHTLQSQVIDLFYRSLSPLGFLALGTKESLMFSDKRSKFEVINNINKIFRLKANG